MTRILRLLMIAAVALPMWQPAAAQKKAVPPENVATEVDAEKAMIAEECQETCIERSALDQQKPITKKFVKRKASKLPGNRAVQQLDICNGGATSTYLPLYCDYADDANHGQMIYPAPKLEDIVGATITSITFHANATLSSSSWGSTEAPVTLKIGKTNQDNFSSSTSFIDVSSFTSSCTLSTIFNNSTDITFSFTTPFIYTGGNLLLDMSCNDGGDLYADITWKAESATNASLHKYSSNDATKRSYLPYITINYEITEYAASLTGDGAFGHVQIGETATSTFVVTNEGANAFTPVVTATGNGFTVTSTGSGQLASGATRNYTVTFAPTAVQDYTGILTLAAQESAASVISSTAYLSGKGINEATVTVADGTATGKLPVYLSYLDAENHGQMIYPTDILDLTPGSLIKSISFYSNTDLTASSGSASNTITLKLGETSQSSYSSVNFLAGLTTVATKTTSQLLDGTTVATFTFNTPYEYQGGNLVIDASCPALEDGQYTSSSVQWLGKNVTGAGILYMYYSSSSSNNVNAVQNFMPKMTMAVEMAAATQTTELDFGSVDVESSKTLSAYIANDSDSPVTAAVTVAPNPPFSVASTTVTLAANSLTSVPVTFAPTEARNYNGTLMVIAGNDTTIIPLKGVGNVTGSPEAIRDKEFFDGITYDWTDSEGSHTSKLSDVATKPEQIIAMLKKVYTDKTIPGNLKRGCDENGYFTEDWSDVSYPAIGEIKYTGTSGNTTQLQNPDYFEWDSSNSTGWGIDTKKDIVCGKNTYTGSSSTYTSYYATFDQTEYRPDNEGVTMLLVEMVDDYDRATYTAPTSTGEQYLKDVVSLTIKSVRIVTEAKRVGEGQSRGTLFNIDCDKMNKFFFLAKGQLRLPFNSKKAGVSSGSTTYYPGADFCPYPLYLYSSNYFGQGELNKFYDYNNSSPFFFQMFEQFSPVNNATGLNIDDLYSNLVKMTSFPVIHDCVDIPFASSTSAQETDIHGHQFMMYGVESGAADCQDVRDLMFFVPDYRMMKWDDGSSNNDGRGNKVSYFHDYNQSHAPTMGLYVILQDEVQKEEKTDTYYKLKLTWDSNMDEFLPEEKQEYQLYQVFTDEFGVSKWIPVYVRNAQGLYKNATTGEWQTDTIGAEPVVLTLNPNDSKTYTDVYEMRESSSRYVTYAIRGCDTGHFLSLQMSNEQSYLIEGLDPAEMAMLSSATIYSRFEAQDVRNCYSNKLQLKSSPQTIKASYLPNGSTMTINRTHRVMENGHSVEVVVPVATLTINTSSKKFSVSGSVLDANVENLFPKGSNDGLVAGYHANNLTNNQVDYSTTTVNGTEYINFDISLWDNFVAEVSNNDHPGLYTYQLKFNTAENFDGLHGSTNEAYSNFFPVYVYKTDSRINEPLTLAQVDGDTSCSDDYKPGDVEFGAHVMLSSKTEILRYDAYRWPAGQLEPRSIVIDGGATDAEEEDADPNGIAGNQGGSYSITMNAIGTADYYVGDPVSVTTAEPWNWATFVDYYPAKNPNALAYVYAPVVELFTRGYQEGSTNKERTDYNTYGGPLKEIALGKLHFNVVNPEVSTNVNNPLMSEHTWEVDGKKYAYYNIKLDIDKKKVPEGYEIYKVRAWREIPESLQGEEYSSLSGRMGARVLFEDITYPGCDGSDNHQVLGEKLKEVTVTGADQTSHTYTSYTGTFGARKLRTEGPSETGVIDELPYKFIVRIYFTKQDNLQTTQNGAPMLKAGNPVLNEDAKFYVAEYEFEDAFDSTNVPTAIQTLNAREAVGVKYYNVAGIESDTPFQGVNIVVTRYSDGSTTTTKILK